MNDTVSYRCSIKIVKRSAGKSVVNTASYISRERLFDKRLSKTFNYSRNKDDILFSEIYLPDGANFPKDREHIWNKVEESEIRKDAQLARLIELNLPYQLSKAEMIETLERYVNSTFIPNRMIIDVNLHKPSNEEGRNYHAHLLLTLRQVDNDKFESHKNRDWNKKSFIEKWRKNWALECSKTLMKAGLEKESKRWEHGHLTLDKQRIYALERDDTEYANICNKKPSKHKGGAILKLNQENISSYVEHNVEDEYFEVSTLKIELSNELKRERELLTTQRKELKVKINEYNSKANMIKQRELNVLHPTQNKKLEKELELKR